MSSSDVSVSWQESSVVGRAFVGGMVVGAAIAFIGMLVGGLLGGLGLGASVGLAAFVAFWGGLGFGGMMGGVAGLIREARIDADHDGPSTGLVD